MLFVSFLASLVFVVPAEAFIHSLLWNISEFVVGLFQFSLQDFKKANSGTEEFLKDKNIEIVR